MSKDCSWVPKLMEWWKGKDRVSPYPWRTRSDLYSVLVAEVLLQRTRRDAVIKVFPSFMERFPDVRELARADVREVEEIILPLGLRKRAGYLVRLARMLTEKEVKGYEDLMSLPGLGKYISSMVSIIVYREKRVALDKNVARVITRLFCINPKNKKRPQDDPVIERIAYDCMPEDHVREYNLALMDLGWEVCLSRKPNCGTCPLRAWCRYAKEYFKE